MIKGAANWAAPFGNKILLILVLALLVCNTTAGLASRLAGSLALAAATVASAVAQVAGLESLNTLHDFPSL